MKGLKLQYFILLGIFVFGISNVCAETNLKDIEVRFDAMQKRIENLEKENKVLIQEIKNLKEKDVFVPKYVGTSEDTSGTGLNLVINGFTDITFRVEEDVNSSEENPNTFSIGQFNLYMNSFTIQSIWTILRAVERKFHINAL